jgi:hypothetical protein
MESRRRAEFLAEFRGLEKPTIANPYLDLMREGIERFADGTLQHPDNMLAQFMASRGATELDTWQFTLIRKYGFQPPNDAVLRLCAKYGPLISLGAGLAYVESRLQSMGVLVVPVDNGSGQASLEPIPGVPESTEFMIVLRGDETYVRDCPPGFNLLHWWPPPPKKEAPMASNSLKYFGGEHVLHAGYKNMAQGDLEYHYMLHYEWRVIEEVELPGNIENDPRLRVYERDPMAVILTGSARDNAIAAFEQSAIWQSALKAGGAARLIFNL